FSARQHGRDIRGGMEAASQRRLHDDNREYRQDLQQTENRSEIVSFRYYLHCLDDRLVPRLVPNGIEIAVVFDPVLVTPALFYTALERIESQISFAELCVCAGNIVEQHWIIRIDMHRTLGEFHRALLVLYDCIRYRAKNAGTRIVRVELEMHVDQLNLTSVLRF